MEAVRKRGWRYGLLVAACVLVFTACDFLHHFGPVGFLQQLTDYGVNPALDNYKRIEADIQYLAAYNGKLYAFGEDGIYEIDEAGFEVTAVYPMADIMDFGPMDYYQTRGRWYVGYDGVSTIYYIQNLREPYAPDIKAGLGTYHDFSTPQLGTGVFNGNVNGVQYEFGYFEGMNSALGNVYDPEIMTFLAGSADNRSIPAGWGFVNFDWDEASYLLHTFLVEYGDSPILHFVSIPAADFGTVGGPIDYPYGYEDSGIELPPDLWTAEGAMWARTDGEKHVAVYFNNAIHVYTLDGIKIFEETLWDEGTAALSSGGDFLFVLKKDHSGDEGAVVINKYRLVP